MLALGTALSGLISAIGLTAGSYLLSLVKHGGSGKQQDKDAAGSGAFVKFVKPLVDEFNWTSGGLANLSQETYRTLSWLRDTYVPSFAVGAARGLQGISAQLNARIVQSYNANKARIAAVSKQVNDRIVHSYEANLRLIERVNHDLGNYVNAKVGAEALSRWASDQAIKSATSRAEASNLARTNALAQQGLNYTNAKVGAEAGSRYRGDQAVNADAHYYTDAKVAGATAAIGAVVAKVATDGRATTQTLQDYLDKCGKPNCKNLSKFGRDLSALGDLLTGGAFLAFLIAMIKEPESTAHEVEDVLGGIARGTASTLRDAIGV